MQIFCVKVKLLYKIWCDGRATYSKVCPNQLNRLSKWKNCIPSYRTSCCLKPPKRNGLNHFIFQPKFPVFPSKINGKYCKIPKISPGAYIFQRPFLRGLFSEGLIFGRAYNYTEGNVRFKIDRASHKVGSKFRVFALFYFVFEGNFPSTSLRGAYIWRGI